jgi:hypothetical protein
MPPAESRCCKCDRWRPVVTASGLCFDCTQNASPLLRHHTLTNVQQVDSDVSSDDEVRQTGDEGTPHSNEAQCSRCGTWTSTDEINSYGTCAQCRAAAALNARRSAAAALEATKAMYRARAQFLAIVAAIVIGFCYLLAWASGSLGEGGAEHPHNGATAGIAGIGVLIGIGIAAKAWRYYRASRSLSDGVGPSTPHAVHRVAQKPDRTATDTTRRNRPRKHEWSTRPDEFWDKPGGGRPGF